MYSQKHSPFATTSSKVLKIDSVQVRAEKITVKLKKAPTTEQFLAVKASDSYYGGDEKNRSAPNNKVYFTKSSSASLYGQAGTISEKRE